MYDVRVLAFRIATNHLNLALTILHLRFHPCSAVSDYRRMSEEQRGRSGGSAGSRHSLRVRGFGVEAVRQLDPVLQAIELSKAEMKGKGNKRKKVRSESIQEGDEDLDRRGDADHDR